MKNTQETKLLLKVKKDYDSSTNFWPEAKYPNHCHEFLELELVLDGQGYQDFNGERFEMKKGCMYLLRPLDHHQITSKNLTVANIQLKEEVLSTYTLQRIFGIKNPVCFNLKDEDFERVQALISLFSNEVNKDSKGSIIQHIGELIFLYYLRFYDEIYPSENQSFVNKISYYLHLNNRFTQKVTLDEIAEHIGYSKFYTSNLFHKIYGMTLQDYLIDLRINYAKKLIIETSEQIGDIVTLTGFSTSSSFFNQFTKRVGLSPLQYRKLNKK